MSLRDSLIIGLLAGLLWGMGSDVVEHLRAPEENLELSYPKIDSEFSDSSLEEYSDIVIIAFADHHPGKIEIHYIQQITGGYEGEVIVNADTPLASICSFITIPNAQGLLRLHASGRVSGKTFTEIRSMVPTENIGEAKCELIGESL